MLISINSCLYGVHTMTVDLAMASIESDNQMLEIRKIKTSSSFLKNRNYTAKSPPFWTSTDKLLQPISYKKPKQQPTYQPESNRIDK